MSKSTIYLVIKYQDSDYKIEKEHYAVEKYKNIEAISKKYNIDIKTISKLITGEVKGEKGVSSKFAKYHDVIKVYTKRIKDYSLYIREIMGDYDPRDEEPWQHTNWEDDCEYSDLF